ncbi:MAG: 4-hydroxy-tetrahydrodipicolinate reductase [Armatimonadetes bacterium]|nr:4-hydroxy-tetrahydrodipicolinate reductase [Armatimonadota bacterium]
MIRVAIAGVCGKMGQETAKAVFVASDMEVSGACDVYSAGRPLSSVVPGLETKVEVTDDLEGLLKNVKPDVLVDFTSPAAVTANVTASLEHRVPAVVGTTGITQEKLEQIRRLSSKTGTPAIIAPNFAIGAVLMMKFAAEAAKYMPAVEIIELHHDKKLDAPSGTSIKTAEMVAGARGQGPGAGPSNAVPARGDKHFGIPIHSVRLPGLVAHQEVIFGGQGQTLTIRHDSIDRTSFMPGVLMAIRKVRELDGVVYGLENLL